MKLNFSKSIGRFRAKSLPLLAGLILSPLAVMATDSTATFTGTIYGTPPNVDATNFVNYGTWTNIYTGGIPYHTADTLNYTNEGSMYGEVGWDFALWPSINGVRGMSASFFNDSLGTIQAVDGSINNPSSIYPYSYSVSHLLVSATNIVNKGWLIAGAGGEIVLTGTNVNLSRSCLEINGISRYGSANVSVTNYVSDTAIYDEYWGQTNTFPNSSIPYTLDSLAIWDGTSVASPPFHVTYLYLNGYCGVTNGPDATIPITGRFNPTLSDSTNIIAAITNLSYSDESGVTQSVAGLPIQIFNQAVFVYTTDPNITASNRFFSTGSISNLFQTVTVRLTNSASGEVLYLQDTLGSSTNRGLLQNINYVPGSNPQNPCSDPTYRPANYNLGGADPGSFANGFPGWTASTQLFIRPEFQ